MPTPRALHTTMLFPKLRTASGEFVVPAPAEQSGAMKFLIDFCAGGVAGAVAKTATAPIERVKLLIQTQDANPKIISGEVARYTGIVDCFTRVSSEQGFMAFWRGNTVNVIRYFPTQAFNFAFKDTIKGFFPKYDPKKEFGKFFAANIASGGLAGAGSLTIVYPLDYARTRLASDVGSGNPQFTGLLDCLMKTAQGGFFNMYSGAHPPPPPSPPFRAAPSLRSSPPSPRALPPPSLALAVLRAQSKPPTRLRPFSAAGFSVSVVGIVAYRGPYFGIFDTLKEKNPFKKEKGIVGLASKFCIAQFTAIVAGFISYPFDTVRRRLQMQAEKPPDQWLYNGTLDCAVKIVRDEGMGAMFKVRLRHVSLPSPSPLPPHPDGAPLLSPRATAHRPFITRSRPSSPPLAPSCLPDLPPLPLPPSHPPRTAVFSPARLHRAPSPAPSSSRLASPYPPPPPCPSHTPVRTLHAWSALHSTHDQHALSAGIRRQRSPHPGRRPRPRWLRRDQAYHWLKACAPGGRGSFSRARKGVHGRARFSCALAIGDAINCEKTRQQAHTT